MPKARKGFLEALAKHDQTTIDKWFAILTEKLTKRRQEVNLLKQKFLPLILELNNYGYSTREITEMLEGQVSHASIARYVKIAKKDQEKEKPHNAETKEIS
jgi:response regulator of citrate/malate metabolism